MTLLCRLRGADRHIVRRRLLLSVERAGLTTREIDSAVGAAFLTSTFGLMAVLMLGLHGGSSVAGSVSLYAFFGYCLLVFAGVLGLRVLVLVFRLDAG